MSVQSLKSILNAHYLARILGLKLRAKVVLEGTLAGWHRSPFHGYSSEFSQYRMYTPGDDLKHLDWRVYGRHDQTVIRQFRDETNTNVHLVLDTSASMGFGDDGFTKLEYGALLAASLTLLAERQRDALSLAYGSEHLSEFLTPESGPLRTREILSRLETLKPFGNTNLDLLCAETAQRIHRQSFFFLFTDGWQSPESISTGLRHVRYKTRAVNMVLLRSKIETDFLPQGNYRLRDMETGQELDVNAPQAHLAYLAAVNSHLAQTSEMCSRLGIRLISIRTDWALDIALKKILEGT